MFFHLFKYRIIKLIRDKEELFWTLMFPLILGTFFYVAFASITSKTENFSSIPVAVVIEDEAAATTFRDIISKIDKNVTKDDNSLLSVTYTQSEDAKKLLIDKSIDGIIRFDDTISLEVSGNGINQTILKSFADQYLHIESVIRTISEKNPDKVMTAISTILDDTNFNTELTLTNGNFDPMILYFYALIAMSCLFGSQLGCTCAKQLKADLSALGSRRCASPAPRMTMILADFFATIAVHFCSIFVLILYLEFVLRIELGSQFLFIVLTGFVGSIIGVSFGFFIGSLNHLAENVRNAIVLMVTMALSFFGGLMVGDMKYRVEQVCPFFNRINPAALISDALYSLSIYETYEKYIFSMSIMIIIAAIFCILSYLVTRRENYDNL